MSRSINSEESHTPEGTLMPNEEVTKGIEIMCI